MFGGVGSFWGHDHPHILFWLGLPFLFFSRRSSYVITTKIFGGGQ